LMAYITLPNNARIVDGKTSMPVDIRAGVPVQLTVVVAFPGTGDFKISAFIGELIIQGAGPMGMYYSSPEDIKYLHIGPE